MTAAKKNPCPDCVSPPSLARRDFIRVLGASAATLAVGGLSPVSPLSPLQKARAARAEKQAQAEGLVVELFKSMDSDQKKKLVMPWDAPAKAGGIPARLATLNAPASKDSVIGLGYDKKQVELLDRIFRAICNGEEGYKRLSRNGKFDNSGSFESSGAVLYGDPTEGKKFSLVFASHHLTVRCDGNSEEATAFGGPLYYGHSPKGFASTNVFAYQAKAVGAVFESLTEAQRKTTVLDNRKWADGVASVKLPPKDAKPAGLSYADMTKEQKELTEKAMKELVSPYRKEDGDEVMEIVKANGGMEKLSLAFYKDDHTEKEGWSFWRLEGPGFVWSFRALEHIHTFVNIGSKLA
jgi:hypothetical protein